MRRRDSCDWTTKGGGLEGAGRGGVKLITGPTLLQMAFCFHLNFAVKKFDVKTPVVPHLILSLLS